MDKFKLKINVIGEDYRFVDNLFTASSITRDEADLMLAWFACELYPDKKVYTLKTLDGRVHMYNHSNIVSIDFHEYNEQTNDDLPF